MTAATTYAWRCVAAGCPWRVSSESQKVAHTYAWAHTDATGHATTVQIVTEIQ